MFVLVVGACWISYWVGRVKPHDCLLVRPFEIALAKTGWKYTSIVVALPWITGLFNSVDVLLRELAVIQEGGTVDTTWIYTLAALNWIVLPTVLTGIILDAVIRGRQSST